MTAFTDLMVGNGWIMLLVLFIAWGVAGLYMWYMLKAHWRDQERKKK